ncbi:MAG: O-acetylhomoserine aminocarboxypropyltransferase/cysteine synthase, partial [Desulfamplus sp.]|nr:O-acetylhomoserine aminocarboxypropyltransferase/cysteine synthase [Desulfamplus sp.]
MKRDNEKREYHFDTRVIHEGGIGKSWQGSTLPPIFQSAGNIHETAENLSDTFAGKRSDHIYMRLSNPTNTCLEEKLASLESGKKAIVMSSGMAAISNGCMALLREGDEFVSSKSLFMSTYLLFTNIFKKYGITVRLVDIHDNEELKSAINEKSRFVYLETIGNPGMDIPDVDRIAQTAHQHGLPLLIDNTLASPWLFRPIEHGADVVIHSTTKYFGGHGAALGGVIIDAGNFDWNSEKFKDFKPFVDRKGELAYLDRVWREHHINFGTTQAPFHSYLTMLGLDTLSLRMERHMSNAIEVARFLKAHPKVSWVNFPGLEDHQCHKTAKRLFGGKGFGSMLTFGLKDEKSCFKFIDNLELIHNIANLGDCKTLIIHPWSTQFVSFEEPVKLSLGIAPEMMRLS